MVEKFLNDESGATSIEYGLVASVVSVAAIIALMMLGDAPQQSLNAVETALTTSLPASDG